MLTTLQQIAIKQEAVAGTAETLAAADAILIDGPATFEPDPVIVDRNTMSGTLSHQGGIVFGARSARIKFAMKLRGSYNHSTGAIAAPVAASTEPDFSVPFKGCGAALAVTGTTPNEQSAYTPSDTTIVDETSGAYCSVALYMDGKKYLIHGAVGNCVLTFENASPVRAEFDFLGCYNTPTDVALLSGPVYPTFVEPVFSGATISIIGSHTATRIKTLKFDMGNEIVMRPEPNTATGYHTAQIVRRRPTISIDPEEVLAATEDFWSQWLAGTLGAVTTGTFPSGGTNYNQFNLNCPNVQYTKVGLADRDGLANAPIEGMCLAAAVAGQDEWSFTQT